jgi:outer membrane lipoprotein SlyB
VSIRTPEQPNGTGPPRTSPNVYRARDFADRWIQISIPWVVAGDGTTMNIQAAITTQRDVGCLYGRVLIGGVTTAAIGEGHGAILPGALGQLTINALEDVGVTFEP